MSSDRAPTAAGLRYVARDPSSGRGMSSCAPEVPIRASLSSKLDDSDGRARERKNSADDDLLGALRGHSEALASYPDGAEAGDARAQILETLNRVEPDGELLASSATLAPGHSQPEGDRLAAPVGP